MLQLVLYLILLTQSLHPLSINWIYMGTQATMICAVFFFVALICKLIDFCCCMLLVYYLSVIVCFPIMQDSICYGAS